MADPVSTPQTTTAPQAPVAPVVTAPVDPNAAAANTGSAAPNASAVNNFDAIPPIVITPSNGQLDLRQTNVPQLLQIFQTMTPEDQRAARAAGEAFGQARSSVGPQLPPQLQDPAVLERVIGAIQSSGARAGEALPASVRTALGQAGVTVDNMSGNWLSSLTSAATTTFNVGATITNGVGEARDMVLMAPRAIAQLFISGQRALATDATPPTDDEKLAMGTAFQLARMTSRREGGFMDTIGSYLEWGWSKISNSFIGVYIGAFFNTIGDWISGRGWNWSQNLQQSQAAVTETPSVDAIRAQNLEQPQIANAIFGNAGTIAGRRTTDIATAMNSNGYVRDFNNNILRMDENGGITPVTRPDGTPVTMSDVDRAEGNAITGSIGQYNPISTLIGANMAYRGGIGFLQANGIGAPGGFIASSKAQPWNLTGRAAGFVGRTAGSITNTFVNTAANFIRPGSVPAAGAAAATAGASVPPTGGTTIPTTASSPWGPRPTAAGAGFAPSGTYSATPTSPAPVTGAAPNVVSGNPVINAGANATVNANGTLSVRPVAPTGNFAGTSSITGANGNITIRPAAPISTSPLTAPTLNAPQVRTVPLPNASLAAPVVEATENTVARTGLRTALMSMTKSRGGLIGGGIAALGALGLWMVGSETRTPAAEAAANTTPQTGAAAQPQMLVDATTGRPILGANGQPMVVAGPAATPNPVAAAPAIYGTTGREALAGGAVTGSMIAGSYRYAATRAATTAATSSATTAVASTGFRAVAGRFLGPVIGTAIAVPGIVSAYQAGDGHEVARQTGGAVGGLAGGAAAGAAVGAMGGPAAVVTVPLGMIVGGLIGWWGGSRVGDYVAGDRLQAAIGNRGNTQGATAAPRADGISFGTPRAPQPQAAAPTGAVPMDPQMQQALLAQAQAQAQRQGLVFAPGSVAMPGTPVPANAALAPQTSRVFTPPNLVVS